MLETYVQILGWLATILGSIMSLAYLPQIYKIYKRKSVADISIIMYAIFFPSILVWLLYGISINNIALIVANAIGLIACGLIIIEYIIYRK